MAGGGGSAGEPATGTGQIPGLSGTVTATYDEHGFLHLACATDDDCHAAMGYLHAQNRFFFMDLLRHTVRGSLGSMIAAGDAVLAQDFRNRLYYSTAQGEPLEQVLSEQADDKTRAEMAAYTRGVNAWLDDMRAQKNGATLTEEYDLAPVVKGTIRDWEVEDSFAVGLYVMHDLSDFSPEELYRARQTAVVGPALATDLLSLQPIYATSILPDGASPTPAPPGEMPAEVVARAKAVAALPFTQLPTGGMQREPFGLRERGSSGSSSWALSPKRTAGGRALLASTPHLALTNPSFWFPVEVDSKSSGKGNYHVAGASIPGLPTVLTGHNEKIAWGVSTAYWDTSDVYLEELSDDGKSVKWKGQDVAIVEKTMAFADASTGTPVMKTLRWVPHHGPIVSEGLAAKKAVSIRWVAHEGSTDLQGLQKLARASTVDEARTALLDLTAADQNFVVIDTAGSIGWFPFSRVPRRPWASTFLPPWMPLPGDGSAEWDGYVDPAQLPQAKDPASGVLVTANNAMTGATADGDPTNDGEAALQSWAKDSGVRARRISGLLDAGGSTHTLETMRSMQGDTYSVLGEVLTPILLKTDPKAFPLPLGGPILEALKVWKFTCPTGLASHDPNGSKSEDPAEGSEARGCTAFHTVLFLALGAALHDEVVTADPTATRGTSDAMSLVMRSILAPATLAHGQTFWDRVTTEDQVETRDYILASALVNAGYAISPIGVPILDDLRWGRVHPLSLERLHDSSAVPDDSEGPHAAPGAYLALSAGPLTFNLTNLPSSPSAKQLPHDSGSSLRTLIEATPDGPRMRLVYPGGADLHRGGPFHNNLVSRWLANEPAPFPFGPGAVTSPALVVTLTAPP